MRPIKLTMQSFGSYGKETTIDFTKTSQNLFLISGDTGAGKSTIFDAMVFALYGEASSSNNKKDGVELQSQYVGYDTKPYVELEFCERRGDADEIYKVRRTPRHIRPAKRGGGETYESESVSLTMPDGSEYPQKETDKKLEEIVGLTKGQFMQVAMIAQGEFMEILRAKTEDKKPIFRKLFNTELFQKIIYELDRRCKEKSTEIAKINTSFRTDVAHIDVPQDYENAQDMSALLRKIGSSDSLSVTDMERLMEELKKLCVFLSAKKDEAQKECQALGKIRDDKRAEYSKAEELLKFFKQLEEAQKDLEDCEAVKKDMAEANILIARIDSAYEIQAVYQRYDEARALAEKTNSEITQLEASLPTLQKTFEEASKLEESAKKLQDAEQENYIKVSKRVEEALKTLDKIEQAKKDLAEKNALVQKSGTALIKAQTAQFDFEKQERAWRQQAEELDKADELLARWEVKNGQAGDVEEEIKSFKEAQREVEDLRKKVKEEQEEYEKARQAFVGKNQEYDAKRTAFLDAQAGFIAKEELREGKPCPVCGSVDHPHPCKLSQEHQDLTREVIDKLSREVERLQSAQETISKTAGASAGALKEKESHLKERADNLHKQASKIIEGLGQEIDLKFTEELLAELKKQLKSEGAKLQEDAKILADVKKSLAGVDEKKSQLKSAIDKAQNEYNEATRDVSAVQINLSILEESAKDYPTKEDANAALSSATEAKNIKDTKYIAAKQALSNATRAKDEAQTKLTQRKQDIVEQTQKQSQRNEEYQNAIKQKGMSEDEWKAVTQQHSKSKMAVLQAQIEEYNKKKAVAEKQFASAKEAIGDKPRPHNEELEKAVEESQLQFDSASSVFESYKNYHKANEDAYKALEPKMKSRGDVIQEYSRLETLYKLLAGKVSGARMDIETFVQRYYLERILYAANSRFLDMSAGQFELRTYDIDKAGDGKNHGLDLMVYSTVTGKEREVRTLSGGESFMAALALALGMADQIQESSAAINLDVMFIDEGFGSLDNHSRNQAVKVLQQMAGGSKLIGIISHVTELKQEIEDQLIVNRDETGSHVKWQNS